MVDALSMKSLHMSIMMVKELQLIDEFRDLNLAEKVRPKSLYDRGATNPSNDLLHGIEDPMTRSKTKRVKQALQGLILKIKEKEDQCELRVAPN